MQQLVHWITIHKNDYDAADEIMRRLYEQGEASSIEVYFDQPHDTIIFEVECTLQNYIAAKKKFIQSGIIFR